jgi:hypothetical protein
MNKKIKFFTPNEAKANSIRYIVQDFLDDLSSGGTINLDEFEKEVNKIINDDVRKWEARGCKVL